MTEENIIESLPTEEIAPEAVPEPIVEAEAEPTLQPVAAPILAPEPLAAKPIPAPEPVPEPVEEEPTESFADLLRDFERSHSHKSEPGAKQLQGTVISLSADQVFLDIGYKTEGVLPRSAFENNAEGVKPGDSVPVSVTGFNEEHYYELSRFKVAQPRDWTALETAFTEKLAVVGTVTEVIKGGLSVDIGAFVEIEPGVEGLIHISEMAWGKKVRHPSDLLKQGDRVDAVILSVKPEERRIALGLKQTLTDPWSEVEFL